MQGGLLSVRASQSTQPTIGLLARMISGEWELQVYLRLHGVTKAFNGSLRNVAPAGEAVHPRIRQRHTVYVHLMTGLGLIQVS